MNRLGRTTNLALREAPEIDYLNALIAKAHSKLKNKEDLEASFFIFSLNKLTEFPVPDDMLDNVEALASIFNTMLEAWQAERPVDSYGFLAAAKIKKLPAASEEEARELYKKVKAGEHVPEMVMHEGLAITIGIPDGDHWTGYTCAELDAAKNISTFSAPQWLKLTPPFKGIFGGTTYNKVE